ncbi:GNAT family N-acetyltransferase [Mycolicibacterium fortuitum]|uniref:GNAT family N-acetyltransferase n=1 Tax=Mycolicibacterium fortuitum TaxID=1766 RepID=UPI0026357313|nr:GNAT family protein [Mycolicibacterium fortuitum]
MHPCQSPASSTAEARSVTCFTPICGRKAAEAARMLLRFGFAQLQLRRISATCHPDNHASARVLEKAGLVFGGRMRSHLLVRGAWRDSLLYAAITDDPALRPVPRI